MPKKSEILEKALLNAKELEEAAEQVAINKLIKEYGKKLESMVICSLQEKKTPSDSEDEDEISVDINGGRSGSDEPGGIPPTEDEMAADGYTSPSLDKDVFNDDLPPDITVGAGNIGGDPLLDDAADDEIQKASFVVPDDLFAEPDEINIAFDSQKNMITIDFGDDETELPIGTNDEFDVDLSDEEEEEEELPPTDEEEEELPPTDEEEEDKKHHFESTIRSLKIKLMIEQNLRKRRERALKEALLYNAKLSALFELRDKIGILPKDVKMEIANRIDEAKTTQDVERVASKLLISESIGVSDNDDTIRKVRSSLIKEEQGTIAESSTTHIDPKFIRWRAMAGLSPLKGK